MTDSPPPNRLKGILILLAVFAVVGAIFGAYSRTEFSTETYEVGQLGRQVAGFAVLGAILGAVNKRLQGSPFGYPVAMLVQSLVLVLVILFVEAVLIVASLVTGGWDGGVPSALVGAVVGMVCMPPAVGFIALLTKLFGQPKT